MINGLLQARGVLDLSPGQLRQQQNDSATPLQRQRLPNTRRQRWAHDAIQASARRRKALGIPVSAIRRLLPTYKRQLLWDIERTFRTTKSLLETRPIYHKLDETIRGHVACSFLALVLKKELEDRLASAANGVRASWPAVVADLDSLTETEVEQDGKRFLLRAPRSQPRARRPRRRPAAHPAPDRRNIIYVTPPFCSATPAPHRAFACAIKNLGPGTVEDQLEVLAVHSGFSLSGREAASIFSA
jgi:hypothetical protein